MCDRKISKEELEDKITNAIENLDKLADGSEGKAKDYYKAKAEGMQQILNLVQFEI